VVKDTLIKQEEYIKVDHTKGKFLVNRNTLIEPSILEEERKKIFSKSWLFLGHETELKEPGSFITRKVGGRSLIFIRDSNNEIKAFHNACPHRGALVSREKEGKTKVFRCFYHAWVFNNKGELVGKPGGISKGFAEDHHCDGSNNLLEVAKLKNYKGFVFVNFDSNACSLEDYLAGSIEYLDYVAEQSQNGMEIIGKSQEYSVSGNWKLVAENAIDGYHAPPTHATYFDYISKRDGKMEKLITGPSIDLGNGHSVVEYRAPWGRPIARWIPSWGEDAKEEIMELQEELEERLGQEMRKKIADTDRNMVIFPNLVINDIMSITIRTFDPVAPDYTEVRAFALGPIEESEKLRDRRLNNFLEFLGPGGFATPDDNEALELVQQGITANREAKWSDLSKGMLEESPGSEDEHAIRVFWEQWNKIMTEE
jgi:p-cumate 2,3-dioxygenase subunit alpha